MSKNQQDVCEIYNFDEKKVEKIQKKIDKQNFHKISQLFKALGDINRSKIVFALCQEDELCVCDFANVIQTSVATTSHHLRTLYKQGIIKFRKEGKMVFYSLDDEHIKQLIEIAMEHTEEVKDHVNE